MKRRQGKRRKAIGKPRGGRLVATSITEKAIEVIDRCSGDDSPADVRVYTQEEVEEAVRFGAEVVAERMPITDIEVEVWKELAVEAFRARRGGQGKEGGSNG